MSARTIAASRQVPVPARVRSDLFDGVSTETADRRSISISILAQFALGEPDDPRRVEECQRGLVAFLPEFCSPRLARR